MKRTPQQTPQTQQTLNHPPSYKVTIATIATTATHYPATIKRIENNSQKKMIIHTDSTTNGLELTKYANYATQIEIQRIQTIQENKETQRKHLTKEQQSGRGRGVTGGGWTESMSLVGGWHILCLIRSLDGELFFPNVASL